MSDASFLWACIGLYPIYFDIECCLLIYVLIIGGVWMYQVLQEKSTLRDNKRGVTRKHQCLCLFEDGLYVKIMEETKYFRCNLNNRADLGKEVRKRIATCMTILKNLDIYWSKANPPKAQNNGTGCSSKIKTAVWTRISSVT